LSIPEEIVFKYNILKENAFLEMGYPFDPINSQKYPNLKKPGF